MLEREMYQEATMEVIEIQTQDVVTTSIELPMEPWEE